MPSLEHEFTLDLIRRSPDLAAQLLGHAAGASPPPYTRARCEAGEATITAPPELRADSVVVLERCAGHDEHTAVQAIIVECQHGYDKRKHYSWPLYVASVRARLRCPVILLVLTATERLARWCAHPIDLGAGHLVHRPMTLALTALGPRSAKMAKPRRVGERRSPTRRRRDDTRTSRCSPRPSTMPRSPRS